MQGRVSLPRAGVIGLTALAVCLPLGLIFYQSLLDAPFFAPHKVGVGAFQFIFADSDFWDALKNSLVIAAAMVRTAAHSPPASLGDGTRRCCIDYAGRAERCASCSDHVGR